MTKTGRLFAALIGMAVILLSAQSVFAQKSKDTLRIPVSDPDSGIEVYTLVGRFTDTFSPSVFDELLAFDPASGKLIGHLAKSFTQIDRVTYEYDLRTDVKWHDGQAFDADDVVHTISYLIDPNVALRYKAYWGWIKSVEKLGPSKVRITAKQWVPDGQMMLASRTPMYPQHLHGPVKNKLDFAIRPVGTGPLRIVQLDKNAGIIGEKYADYVPNEVKPPAGFGRLFAEPIKDMGTLTAAMLTGQADVAVDLSPDQSEALVQSGRFEVTLGPPQVGYSLLGFPAEAWSNVKALSDPRVRRAIVMAVDRQALIDIKYGPLGKNLKPLDALCTKEQLGCGYTQLVPSRDLAAAKKLLAEAGYADGFDVTISTFALYATEATAVAGMLRSLGIRASVRQHPTAQRVQLIKEGKVEIGYYGWGGGSMFEVSGSLGRFVDSNEFNDPILQKLAAATYTIENDQARRAEVAKVFDRITNESFAFAMIPNQPVFTHTKEVKLTASTIRADLVNPHEFAWK